MYKPKVYTASKLHHARFWRLLRNDPEWDFVDFTARWIDIAEQEQDQPNDDLFREAWIHDVHDIKISDFVLLYAVKEYGLRGALVEVGVGLGIGLTVIAVGVEREHTWTFHPNVKCLPSLREAKAYLYRFTTMVPPNRRKGRLDE